MPMVHTMMPWSAALVVLAIADYQDGATLVGLPFGLLGIAVVAVAQSGHAFVDGIADGGALCTDEVSVDLVEKHLGGAIVVGERHLDVGPAGEDDERDAVAAQSAHQVLYHLLAASHAAGLHVLGQHAVRHVDAYGHVDAFLLALGQRGTHEGVGKCHNERCQCQREQCELDDGAAARDIGPQAFQHLRRGEVEHLFAAAALAHREDDNHQRYDGK